MIGWHHLLNGHEFEQTLEDSEGQRSLICCSPRGCRELYTTERLNNNTINMYVKNCIDLICKAEIVIQM